MNIEIITDVLSQMPTIIHIFEEDVEGVNYSEQYKLALTIINSPLDDNLNSLLTDVSLSKREQSKLLTKSFDAKQVPAFFAAAAKLRYKFTQKTFEKIPEQYTEEQIPTFATIKENGEVEQYGSTMSDDGVKRFIEEHKRTIVRITYNEEHWHCFIFDYSGIAGRESGKNGQQCHCHYISDKFGIDKDELLEQLSQFHHPSCCIHMRLLNYR